MQLLLETMSRQMLDNKVIGSNQHGFTEAKSCLTNLINTYDEMAGLVDERIAVDSVSLDSSKAFDTVCHKEFVDELMKYWLDEQTVKLIENCATDHHPWAWTFSQSLAGGH